MNPKDEKSPPKSILFVLARTCACKTLEQFDGNHDREQSKYESSSSDRVECIRTPVTRRPSGGRGRSSGGDGSDARTSRIGTDSHTGLSLVESRGGIIDRERADVFPV